MKPITQYPFPKDQFMLEVTEKTQLYLHHTAGNPNPIATFQWWASTPEKVATCIAIGGNPGKTGNWKDGEIVQGFSSQYWAYHLGLTEAIFTFAGIPYKSLDKFSIAVEICNWGPITFKNGKYYNYVGGEVPKDQVIELAIPFKNIKLYHKYTEAQIESVYELAQLWKTKYKRNFSYNEDIWNVTPRALKGENGLFTHNSVRKDKNDITPQPLMIAMLKTL